MKILLFMPNIERGGIEKNIILLSDYFLKKKVNVKIFYSKISKEVKSNLNKKIKLEKSKKIFNFFFLSERLNNSLNCFISMINNIKRNENITILSFQDHPMPILVSKIKKIKCFIRVANHPKGSLFYFNNFFKYKIKLFIKIFFYRFADGIISNSKSSSDYFQNRKINNNIYTIYNPYNFKKKYQKIKITIFF